MQIVAVAIVNSRNAFYGGVNLAYHNEILG